VVFQKFKKEQFNLLESLNNIHGSSQDTLPSTSVRTRHSRSHAQSEPLFAFLTGKGNLSKSISFPSTFRDNNDIWDILAKAKGKGRVDADVDAASEISSVKGKGMKRSVSAVEAPRKRRKLEPESANSHNSVSSRGVPTRLRTTQTAPPLSPIKRIKLIVRHPEPMFSNPFQLPTPKFNSSLSDFLNSYLTSPFDTKDTKPEVVIGLIRKEAKHRNYVQKLQSEGRLVPKPDDWEQDRPKRAGRTSGSLQLCVLPAKVRVWSPVRQNTVIRLPLVHIPHFAPKYINSPHI
jgi:hypothetical protein